MSTMNGGSPTQAKATTSEISVLAALNSVIPSRNRVFLRKTEDAKFEQVPPATPLRQKIVCEGGNLILDASLAEIFDIDTKKAVTVLAPTNGYDGQRILLCFRQRGIVSTVSWDALINGVDDKMVSNKKNTSTYVTLFYDAPLGRWLYVEAFSVSNS